MKSKSLISLLLLSFLAACSSTQWTDSSYYEDDIYYSPQNAPMTVSDDYIPVKADKEVKKQDKKDFNQLARDYEKTELAQEDNRNFSQIQNEYLGLLGNDSIQETDSLIYYNEETGYWVNGFQGGQMDQDYAERMIRFHGPFNGIPYWSPLYNDMIYFNNWDWNVYVDGNYAYAFPSWTSPMYNSYRYGYGYHNPWRWGYSGFYDPWYGYGFGHNHWYSCGYWPGYHNGYYNGYYHGGGGYYSGGSGSSYPERINQPRYGISSFTSEDRASSTSRIPRLNNATSTTQRKSNVSYTPDNKMVIENNGQTYTRVSRSQYDQSKNTRTKSSTNTGSSSQVRTTRRTYNTPSTNTNKTNTNKSSSYTRSSKRPGGTSATNRRSSYSNTNRSSSNSNRSYSGSSNRSNYSSGSSRSKSTSSPSRSSNTYSSPSRSSGSSSRSYSGSSGSSGSSSRSSGSSSSSSSGGSRTTRSGR